MNIKAYIESGVLESYVLGLASREEIAEVENLKALYPEIRAEIQSIENALEKYALANLQTPPKELKNAIWNKIQSLEKNETKTLDFETGNENTDNQTLGTKRFLSNYLKVAASVALLMSVLGNIYLLNKYDRTKANLESAIKANIDLQKDIKSQEMMMPEEVNLMMSPTIKLCKLIGQKNTPTSTVMLAWDMQTNKIYVLRPNLPKPPSGKQYQLWAIMGDKPVDAGVFDINMRIQELKKTPMPSAFAVTLENTGGSPRPTSEIYAMGL